MNGQYAFPGVELVAAPLYFPQLPLRPLTQKPDAVLFNDGTHLYYEPSFPWPGQEKQFELLGFRRHQRGNYLPGHYSGVRVTHCGHRGFWQTGQPADIVFAKNEKFLSICLMPGKCVFVVEFAHGLVPFIKPFYFRRMIVLK